MVINTIIFHSPDSISKKIAARVKQKRLEHNLTQKAFSKRAGVGYDAYRNFENTGDITLRNLLLCALALDEAEGFDNLFRSEFYQSIDDLLRTTDIKQRKRGSKNE